MTSTLSRWLADRSREELASILVRRPETFGARHLGEVAARLSAPYGIETVLRDLPLPCVEILETIVVYGMGGIRRNDLARVLGVDGADATFTASLDVLALWAVAWELDGEVQVPPALPSVMPRPLHLGPPVADLLNPRTVDDLRSRASTLGLEVTPRKTDLVEALVKFYRDAPAVRDLSEATPSAQRELLAEAVWQGPVLRYEGSFFYTGRPDPAISWLLTHGLAIADWQTIVVPREVALAIRGDDWHPTLTPRPELATPVAAAPDAVDRDAAAAAATAVDQVAVVLDACAANPPAMLKTGGIGVRDLRRLAKATALDEASVRLWLALATEAELVDVDDEADELVPTSAYDEWLSAPQPRRVARLVQTWFELRTVPVLTERPDGAAPKALLSEDPYPTVAADLRRDVLGVAAEIPVGRGVRDADALVAPVVWRRPALATLLGDPRFAVVALWTEATLLGAAARGALSTLGRAVVVRPSGVHVDDPIARLTAAATKMMPAQIDEAIFQADLTVIVAGRPSVELAELLDSVADRESRGGAATWRCSTASIRRALDAGHTAETLVAALRRVAVGGRLPQPLEYAVSDAARVHGGIRVRTVGCVLRADDEALLAELVAARPLARLALSTLAPTVLASALDVPATLAALRSAGYAPVGEASDGAPLLERVPKRRTAGRAAVVPLQSRREPPVVRDPYDVAETLLAMPVPEPELPPTPTLRLVAGPSATTTPALVSRYASQLSVAEQELLSRSIDDAQPVRIAYTSGAGEVSARVIEPIELAGGMLVAWCRLRDDERNFALARIDAVSPAS